jgi:hypothetical protein
MFWRSNFLFFFFFGINYLYFNVFFLNMYIKKKSPQKHVLREFGKIMIDPERED